MAYVVKRPRGRWEVRESIATERGPRARTLATFRTLSPAVVQRAVAAATRPTSAVEIRDAARRAGAGASRADEAARSLLFELAHGREPSPGLRRALLGWLSEPRDNDPVGGGVAEWLGASPADRGQALRDLLGFVDALPPRPRPPLRFPPLRGQGHAGA